MKGTSFFRMISSPIFLSAFFSWFTAQLIKLIINVLRRRIRSSKGAVTSLFWATGGMPSSHSAAVAALATSVGFTVGVDSPLFVTILVFGLIVVRDALGVRRAAGHQARALNNLGRELSNRFNVQYRSVKEINGHNFSEVSVGILLGFFIATAFCNL